MVSSKLSTRSKLLILTAVMASLLEIIDTSIVNVAIPTMMGNLGATLNEISWVITGYIIANAIVLPIAAWMSQQIGRKAYYTGCILLFTAASVACGLAPNLPTLVVFRIIQGFAGGALLPTSQALIYEALPKEMAGMASAIYGMSVMIGPTIGPTLGGYLTDNLGWRSIFNINLPLGLVVSVLSYLLVEDVGFDANATAGKPSPVRKRVPVDGWGLGLLVVGVGTLQYVLERGNAEDWFNSKLILFSTLCAATSLVALIWWELRVAHPILQLRLFKNLVFRSGVLLMVALGAMLYGLIFLIPVFVSSVLNLTATQTGMLFIPGALASALAMPFVGIQLQRRDPRVLIAIGIFGLSIGALLMGRFDSQTSVQGMFWPLLIRGIAMAFLFVPINGTVLTQFAGVEIGQAAGLLNLSRQIGGSVFIAVLSVLLDHYQVSIFSAFSNHITLLDPAAAQMWIGLKSELHIKLSSLVGNSGFASDALKLLYYRATKQSFVLAYQRVLVIAVIFFLAIALFPLTQLKRPKKPAKGVALDAH